jgi:5'-3' exonuclease
VGNQRLSNGEDGQKKIGEKNILNLLFYEDPVIKLWVENMMKEKTGDKNKKSTPSGYEVRQKPVRKGTDMPPADTVTMASNYQYNSYRTKIF